MGVCFSIFYIRMNKCSFFLTARDTTGDSFAVKQHHKIKRLLCQT
jgi:hypothetical protein